MTNTTVRLIACTLTALVLTGCATAGPRPAPTESELRKAADRRVCGKQTRGYRFIPWVGGIVRTIEYDKCMQARGWDVLSAKDRQALYGTSEAPALLPPPSPPPPPGKALPLPEPAWDTGL